MVEGKLLNRVILLNSSLFLLMINIFAVRVCCVSVSGHIISLDISSNQR